MKNWLQNILFKFCLHFEWFLGYQSREYECQRIIDSQVVADSECKDIRPRGKIRTCNDDCYLQ